MKCATVSSQDALIPFLRQSMSYLGLFYGDPDIDFELQF